MQTGTGISTRVPVHGEWTRVSVIGTVLEYRPLREIAIEGGWAVSWVCGCRRPNPNFVAHGAADCQVWAGLASSLITIGVHELNWNKEA